MFSGAHNPTFVYSGVAKSGPGWAHAHPTYIPCLPKCLVCPVISPVIVIKRLIYSNKTIKHSIKKVSSKIFPT